MRPPRKNREIIFVSFSGIDGAGKSTQIEALCARLKEDGLQVLLIRFWMTLRDLLDFGKRLGTPSLKATKELEVPLRPSTAETKTSGHGS